MTGNEMILIASLASIMLSVTFFVIGFRVGISGSVRKDVYAVVQEALNKRLDSMEKMFSDRLQSLESKLDQHMKANGS
uniref:Holin n=1 Tax=viral metagenome TaxID=1070528 RepID=A0A6H2A1Q6_9ZZZZ